ncbi:MAG: isocitrate/isopropylmalate dehydrogenase family protein, partial [Anaerolineae bacterium]|nr:isocitrate/isopropylmalate dehydrogenase family protein [Anaerolineae bacterium]
MELCVIPGDGIGTEVVPAALEVLLSVLPAVQVQWARAGWDCFQETGSSLPEATIALTRECGAVFFGAANSPSYPVKGYFSPIVRLRRLMNTHANLRPTRYLPVPAAREGMNLLVVRENTEDLYIGDEQSNDDMGTARKVITRAASERIAHTAFQLARQSGRQRVTIVHKSNVMPGTDGLFRRVAFEVAQHYPDIQADDLLVDTAAYWLVKDPLHFDVILTTNLYGDILSDMAAAWGGGLGLAPALNLGDDIAIAEPVHGSAPDIAGQGSANPTAAILSIAMLVRYYWKQGEAADRIEQAVY